MSEPTGRITDHANELDSSHGGEHAARDRIAALIAAASPRLRDKGRPNRSALDAADAVVAALPELAELDRLCAEVIRLTNRLTALESANGELLARAETAEAERDRQAILLDKHRETLSVVIGQRGENLQRAEQAEAERDTAQAAITRAREHLAKLIELGQFTEKATVAEIVPLLHHLDAALTPLSERCTCGETACESELCDCDATPCPVNHRTEETDHG